MEEIKKIINLYYNLSRNQDIESLYLVINKFNNLKIILNKKEFKMKYNQFKALKEILGDISLEEAKQNIIIEINYLYSNNLMYLYKIKKDFILNKLENIKENYTEERLNTIINYFKWEDDYVDFSYPIFNSIVKIYQLCLENKIELKNDEDFLSLKASYNYEKRNNESHFLRYNSDKIKIQDLFVFEKKEEIESVLFSPIVEESKRDELFNLLLKDEYKEVRKIINSWYIGLEKRKEEEKTFIVDFQTSFNSRYWELYLNACLKLLNIEVDYEKESPDFFINYDNKKINIEAVIANSANDKKYGYNTNDIINSFNIDRKEIIKEASLRLNNGIKNKHKRYLESYNKKEWVEKNPFIIAISPNMGSFAGRINNQSINEVLYGLLDPELNENNEMIQKEIKYHINNEKEIKMGLFRDDKMKEISAVIFSNTAGLGKAISQTKMKKKVNYKKYYNEIITNKNINSYLKINKSMLITPLMNSIEVSCNNEFYEESLLEGIHIYLNPYADKKLDIEYLKNEFLKYGITINSYDIEKNQIISFHPDGSLVFRFIIDKQLMFY